MSRTVSLPVALERHTAQWGGCVRCEIGKIAENHVFFRGSLPCHVLFVGEAPGKQENVAGVPFVGRSGKLLDGWIRAIGLTRPYAITNTVACRPCDKQNGPNRAPTEQEVSNCRPRLIQALELAQPKAIVCLGRTAENSLPGIAFDVPVLTVWHPAYVLRCGGAGCAEDRKTIASLGSWLKEKFNGRL